MSKASRIAFLGVAACAIALALPPAARGDTVANGFASLAYRPIGPAISGGRTTAVAASDVDPSIYYAGGADGGVWKSLDGGTSWRLGHSSRDSATRGVFVTHDAGAHWKRASRPYTARLIVDGVAKEQPVVVKADPRDPSTPDELEARHAILRELNGELDQVDRMPNAIDRRLKGAAPAQAVALHAFKRRLTLEPANIEDLTTPPRIRDRLLDLLIRVGSSSFQAPTVAQTVEAAQLRTQTAALAADYAEVK